MSLTLPGFLIMTIGFLCQVTPSKSELYSFLSQNTTRLFNESRMPELQKEYLLLNLVFVGNEFELCYWQNGHSCDCKSGISPQYIGCTEQSSPSEVFGSRGKRQVWLNFTGSTLKPLFNYIQ